MVTSYARKLGCHKYRRGSHSAEVVHWTTGQHNRLGSRLGHHKYMGRISHSAEVVHRTTGQ